MDIKRASAPHHQHGSSDCGVIYKFNSDHLLLLLVSMFLLVYPLAATPLFPHVSLFRRKACLSVHHRDFPLVDAVVVVDACTLFTTPIIVSARTCQQ
jgi:hypothetical protein